MSININKDSRNRGLEILLYRPEKNQEKLNEKKKSFHLNLKIPFTHKEFDLSLDVSLKDNSKDTENT